MKGLVIKLVAFMGIALFFFGCSDNSTSPAGSGILKVTMTDSPAASYSQVNIVIDSVQAHIAGSDSLHGWYNLNSVPGTYDLLTLVNGVEAVLGQDTLPPGMYSQIRLFIGTGSNVVINNQPYPLTIPSGVQSGLKLNVDANLEAGFLYTITLDFDANMSIVVSGTLLNPQYTLKPVIRSAANATTGIIKGIVSPASASSSVWAVTGTDSSSTSTDATGGFKLIYLTPGTYNVIVAPKDTATYRDTTIANVAVTAASTVDLGTVTVPHK